MQVNENYLKYLQKSNILILNTGSWNAESSPINLKFSKVLQNDR